MGSPRAERGRTTRRSTFALPRARAPAGTSTRRSTPSATTLGSSTCSRSKVRCCRRSRASALPFLEPLIAHRTPHTRAVQHRRRGCGFPSARDAGLTASHRFAKLLHTDSVVLKETSGWEEYYHAALTPWVHYVPVLNGTIWDPFYIVGNFTRDGREGDFRAIAKRAQEFAGTYLCHRARALYWLRLLQEYRGLFRRDFAVHLRAAAEAKCDRPYFCSRAMCLFGDSPTLITLCVVGHRASRRRGGEEMDAFISELEASRAGNWSTMQRFESKDYQDGGTPHLLRHGGGDEAGGGRR